MFGYRCLAANDGAWVTSKDPHGAADSLEALERGRYRLIAPVPFEIGEEHVLPTFAESGARFDTGEVDPRVVEHLERASQGTAFMPSREHETRLVAAGRLVRVGLRDDDEASRVFRTVL